MGNDEGSTGVGIFLAEKWIDKVIDINRVNDRIMLIKLIVGKSVVSVVSAYAPQSVLDDSVKDVFYDERLAVVSKLGEKETVFVTGDINGHVGKLVLMALKVYMGVFDMGEEIQKAREYYNLVMQQKWL